MELTQVTENYEKTFKTAESATTNKADRKLKESAQKMEGMFLTLVFKAMEKTIPRFGEKGTSQSLADMMFSMVMGEDLARKGGVGLSRYIYQALKNKPTQSGQIPTEIWLENVSQMLSGRKYE